MHAREIVRRIRTSSSQQLCFLYETELPPGQTEADRVRVQLQARLLLAAQVVAPAADLGRLVLLLVHCPGHQFGKCSQKDKNDDMTKTVTELIYSGFESFHKIRA